MQELNMVEVDEVNGGVIVNPWTVMSAVRCAQIAAPYAARAALTFVAAAGAALGYEHGTGG